MLVLSIILVILLIILLMPVGVDFALRGGETLLKLKLGPFRVGVLPKSSGDTPKKKKPRKEKKKKEKKPKKAKKRRGKKGEAPQDGEQTQEKPKKKRQLPKITRRDVVDLLQILLRMLGRFRRSLSLDVVEVHLIAAAPDPYDTVMLYGRVNAALGALMPLVRKAVRIRREDISADMSFDLQKTEITARVVATLQIWEILHIVFCALGSAIVLLARVWRASRRAQKAARLKAAQGKEK